MTRRLTSTLAAFLACLTLSTTAFAYAEKQLPTPQDPPQLETDNTLFHVFRAALEKRRADQIRRLERYRDDGIFPRNRISNVVTNIFRDADGVLCAIAFLIDADGHDALLEETAKNNNQVRIGELKDGALVNWVILSGLTQDEVAMIQLPDSPVTHGGRDWMLEENERLVRHLDAAIASLKRNNDVSLDLATMRLLSRFSRS